MKDIYISTSCNSDVADYLFSSSDEFVEKPGLELGFSLKSKDVDYIVSQASRKGVPLLAHNFFYPQNEELVINLSDPNPVKCRASLDYTIAMVDYCAKNNIAAYSIHSGFACSFSIKDFGQPISSLPSTPLQEAYDVFIHNLRLLIDYATEKKINLLFENNVLTRENLTEGYNRHLLCVTAEDILYVLARLERENIRVLLDLGHLNVSATTLDFSPVKEVSKFAKFVGQVHIHDNDGKTDQHYPTGRTSWFWGLQLLENIPLIIEQPGVGIDMIISQIKLICEMEKTYAE